MTEERFQYIRGEYRHGIQDTVKDGKHRKGYRPTYDDFDLDKLTDELNIRENRIKQLENENEQLKSNNKEYVQGLEKAKATSQSWASDVRELREQNCQLEKENKQLKEALKNSYINEICENCKYGNYYLSDNFDGGFEGDFECLKEHFGNDHWKCDGLTECDDFELEIKGDVE